MELSGATALVTGGATGLGEALVRELARRGAGVGFTFSSSSDAADRVVRAVGDAGGSASAIRADVTSTDDVVEAVRATVDRFGRLDIVVNNAGTTRWIPVGDLDAADDEAWRDLLDVNLLGAFRVVRAAAPHLRSSGGSILNVASNSALTGSGSSIPYVVSKAGLVSLTRVLASALAPEVRVNAIAPGWMDTSWLDRHIPSEVRTELRGEQPFVDVADVARAGVNLLASDAATGQVLVLDRGESAGITLSRSRPPPSPAPPAGDGIG